jgi:hypothetical protein
MSSGAFVVLVAVCAVLGAAAGPTKQVLSDVVVVPLEAAGATTAPSACGVDNVTLEHWGASPSKDRFNFTMGSDNVTYHFGLSPCAPFQFADGAGFLCDRNNKVNIQAFMPSVSDCAEGYVTASTPPPSYDKAGKQLRLYFLEFDVPSPKYLDVIVDCDEAATSKPVGVSGTLREGQGIVLTFKSAAACAPDVPTTPAPVPTGPPGPSGEPGTTAPPTTTIAPTLPPPTGPTPPPEDHSTREPVSASVVVGGCILGISFFAVICILRRWAVQSQEEAQGEYNTVAEDMHA